MPHDYDRRRMEMKRQLWLCAKWMLGVLSAIAVFLFAAAPGGGSCGVCNTRWDMRCYRNGCNRPCTQGVCYCEEWNFRECVGSGNDCQGTHTGNVPVTVSTGYCTPGGPTGCWCVFTDIFRELRAKEVCTPCP